MRYFIFILLLFTVVLVSCDSKPKSTEILEVDKNTFDYGTQSDSARYYYTKGWEYIMDNGEWTKSEAAYRKAVEIDSNFLIAKSLLGRLERNLDERQKLLKELQYDQDKASAEVRLLLDSYIRSIDIITAKELGNTLDKDAIKNYYSNAENNLRTFIHKYPNEDYIKAEYIEVLHGQYGPQRALDSMAALASERQKALPFYISYSAFMHSELGNYKTALNKANQLKTVINDSLKSSPYATYAQIYFDMDSLQLAKNYIERTLLLEPNHVIAKRLKVKIDAATN